AATWSSEKGLLRNKPMVLGSSRVVSVMMECPDLYGDCNRGGHGWLKSLTRSGKRSPSRNRWLHEKSAGPCGREGAGATGGSPARCTLTSQVRRSATAERIMRPPGPVRKAGGSDALREPAYSITHDRVCIASLMFPVKAPSHLRTIQSFSPTGTRPERVQ